MRREMPGVALRAQVGLPDALLQQIAEGILDLAVVYAPRYWPGLTVDMIFEERLILVTTDPGATGVSDPGYVYVDWGPEFATHHRMNFPRSGSPGVQVGLGPLGLDYILQAGGTGYFRQRVAEPHLVSGRLHTVAGAPEFVYPVYAVHASDRGDAEVIETALRGMREAARA
jgi:DNA-binding transcriptional LysR family regulator